MRKTIISFIGIVLLTVVASLIAMPPSIPVNTTLFGRPITFTMNAPVINFSLFGRQFYKAFELKQGLDIQGGMQVVLEADMTKIPEDRRREALETAREVMMRRVDLYGINEPVVQTSINGDQYRLLVELAGVTNPDEALTLLGTTAQLSFRLQDPALAEGATESAELLINSFKETGLTGADLSQAVPAKNPTTGEPVIDLTFNSEGTKKFADITTQHVGEPLAIFLDEFPIMAPVIQTPITTGQAQLTGGFTAEQADQLAIQLRAGALPVPISVIEQRTIGASLGQQSVQASLRAGVIGIGLVMLFMILYYGLRGGLASLALVIYAILTVAAYKIIGITLTLPGIAGLLLSIGMAVDANILIFERMKEEQRLGRPFEMAMNMGFGRAWDSIKDANLATIATALILINPLDLAFLNTSGLVRGFGVTLLIGVLISLFTGVVVTRTLMKLFLQAPKSERVAQSKKGGWLAKVRGGAT